MLLEDRYLTVLSILSNPATTHRSPNIMEICSSSIIYVSPYLVDMKRTSIPRLINVTYTSCTETQSNCQRECFSVYLITTQCFGMCGTMIRCVVYVRRSMIPAATFIGFQIDAFAVTIWTEEQRELGSAQCFHVIYSISKS